MLIRSAEQNERGRRRILIEMREGWMEQHFHSGNVTGEIAGLLKDHLDLKWYAASVGLSVEVQDRQYA